MKIMLLIVAMCMTLLAHGAASASDQQGVASAKKTPVPLMLDPRITKFRIGPPKTDILSSYRAMSSTINVHFLHAGETGLWGDVAINWPTDASNALLYAIRVWEYYASSPVPITIEATMCANLGPGVLGWSGATTSHRDFSGAPVTNTWYDAALANSLYGADLSAANDDMAMAFSSAFSWFYGTNGTPTGSQVDFVSVVLHEICHGLGFSGSMNVAGGVGIWGSGSRPWIYDRFTETNPGTNLINTSFYANSSVALGSALRSDNVYFNGTCANAANGGSRVKLYAPGTWASGSSYAHLDEIFNGTSNAMMTYAIGYGEVEHNPGPVTLGLLRDLGWQMTADPYVDVTNANETVLFGVSSYTVRGSNNVSAVGMLQWTNALTGSNGALAVGAPWWNVAVLLNVGTNLISVSGTNIYGSSSSDSVTITRLPEPKPYVDVTNANAMVSYGVSSYTERSGVRRALTTYAKFTHALFNALCGKCTPDPTSFPHFLSEPAGNLPVAARAELQRNVRHSPAWMRPLLQSLIVK